MSTDLIPLAFLMFLVTYPSRAVGLLAPGIERLPRRAMEYLQLVGPALLAHEQDRLDHHHERRVLVLRLLPDLQRLLGADRCHVVQEINEPSTRTAR